MVVDWHWRNGLWKLPLLLLLVVSNAKREGLHRVKGVMEN